MKPSTIIQKIMKLRGFSNMSLATKLGKSTASAVSNKLSRDKGMRIDAFIEMVEAMDCEIIIRSSLKDRSEWRVTQEDDRGAFLPNRESDGIIKT
jgi:predicted transcriptional regulator